MYASTRRKNYIYNFIPRKSFLVYHGPGMWKALPKRLLCVFQGNFFLLGKVPNQIVLWDLNCNIWEEIDILFTNV